MSYVNVQGESAATRIGKIVCVGANYAGHNKEMGRANKVESILFLKPPSAILNDGSTFTIPAFTLEVHHELEIVLLLGSGGKKISVDQAKGCIKAIGIGLDMTARDMQRVAKAHGLPWAVPKGFDGSALLSDFVPLPDHLDLDQLTSTLKINGEIRQKGNTADMLLNCPALISYASRFFTLEENDLIFTGTPEGVGLVKPGDKLELSLDGVVAASFSVTAENPDIEC